MSRSTFPSQLLHLVVRPVLTMLDLGGTAAEMLIVGTAAKESDFAAIKQIGGGPALSLWQIEPKTARDTWNRLPKRYRDVVTTLVAYLPAADADADPISRSWLGGVMGQLPGNLYLGAAMCRLVYYLKPFVMPREATVEELAAIWKKHYNTVAGAGKASEFVDAWHRHRLEALWK